MLSIANQGKKRIIYLDVLRVLAIFGVIMIHVSAQNWYSTDVYSYEWNVFNIYDSLVRWAVPIFVMISGALFLDNEKSLNLKKLYTKNIFHLISAYLFWALVYAVWQGGGINKVITNFIDGPFHMWFLFMMAGLYIIIPILKKVTENEQVMEYFLMVSLMFTFIIPNVLNVSYLSFAKELYEKVYFHLTLGYSCYFVCGYYLSKKEIAKSRRILLYSFGGGAILATIFLSALSSRHFGIAYDGYYNEFSINVMLESIAVFVFIKNKYSKQNVEKREVISSFLSKYSFGIYLVHILVINVLNQIIGLNTLSFDAFISVPVITFIVFMISLIISILFSYIPIIGKYVV